MGLAVTERLVSQGWNVAIMDLNEEAGHEVAERLGPQVLFLKADVTSYGEQGEVFRRTWERWGRLNFGMCLGFHYVHYRENGGQCKSKVVL
jgi:NAD(P)-dependent dehydrogenase (short-subunit alcohol dehydrogenase family)